jgi:hypothetical protein
VKTGTNNFNIILLSDFSMEFFPLINFIIIIQEFIVNIVLDVKKDIFLFAQTSFLGIFLDLKYPN